MRKRNKEALAVVPETYGIPDNDEDWDTYQAEIVVSRLIEDYGRYKCTKCKYRFKQSQAYVRRIVIFYLGSKTIATARNICETCLSEIVTYIETFIAECEERVASKQ